MIGYQVMPRLTADEYAELEQSIRENGVQVPITVGPDGRIIDGHHRDEIARKLDLHCPRVTAQGDEQKLRSLAFSLNLHRRHLTREQKRQVIAESLKADPQLSNREHARRTGANHETVQKVREATEESGEIRHFSERIDPRTGNASQPASRPQPAPQFAPSDEIAPGMTAGQLDELNVKPSPELATPTKPRRGALTEDANRIGWEIRKAVERLESLMGDDRYHTNQTKVTPLLRGHLQYAIEVTTTCLANLTGEDQ